MNVRGFGKVSDGRKAGLYILKNSNGMKAGVTDYGAALMGLIVPCRKGDPVDVVLGYEDAAAYEAGEVHFGATVGRVGNRIEDAKFVLDGKTYELEKNDGEHSLHGGRDYYNKRFWETKVPFAEVSSRDIGFAYAKESMNDGGRPFALEDRKGDSVTFVMDSPDGDQGYPGSVHIEVTYTLTEENELHIDYMAKMYGDEAASTPLNLTNHSYFNLSGHNSGSVLGQEVFIKADRFTPTDSTLIPTGELKDVTGTPMDFRVPKPIGQDIGSDYLPIVLAGGFDHNFVLNDSENTEEAKARGTFCEYREVAGMHSEETGIRMTVLTDLPGMQFYTGNFLDNEPGKELAVYAKRSGACFETQFWPDAINRDNFPGGILKAGETFISRTTYKFSW